MPYNEYESTGTGFSPLQTTMRMRCYDTIRYAMDIYYNHRREWNKLIDRGMAADFSWNSSARKYEQLYRDVLGW